MPSGHGNGMVIEPKSAAVLRRSHPLLALASELGTTTSAEQTQRQSLGEITPCCAAEPTAAVHLPVKRQDSKWRATAHVVRVTS